MTSTTVAWVCVALILVITLFDVWLALDSTRANTISATTRRLGKVWPPLRLIVSFALGVIIGHIWWT